MGNRIYAVIDTNVIVSALIATKAESPPFIVLAHVYSGSIIPVFNDEILREYQEVLSRPKFHLPLELIERALSVFRGYGLRLERTKIEKEWFPDPKDIVFYEVKMSKEEAFLVTGNPRHFPKSSLIVTPRELVGIIDRESFLD